MALGLIFLGKQETAEATIEVAKTLSERVSKFAVATLESCAYAGTGDVLRVQALLAQCGEHIATEDDDSGWKVGQLGSHGGCRHATADRHAAYPCCIRRDSAAR